MWVWLLQKPGMTAQLRASITFLAVEISMSAAVPTALIELPVIVTTPLLMTGRPAIGSTVPLMIAISVIATFLLF
jgi:hypothetical protein